MELRIDRSVPGNSIAMRFGCVGVRDALPEDAEAYVKYWHFSGERIKNLLRIDRERLGGPDDARRRFMGFIRQPGVHQPCVLFTLTLNGVVMGYTNVNRYSPTENFPHFHTYMHTHRELVRQALGGVDRRVLAGRGSNIAAVLAGASIEMFFRLLPIERVSLQTRPTSIGINDALDNYLPAEETRHFDKADGLAGPGVFHMRHLLRKDAGWVLERARAIAGGSFKPHGDV
ncbi:hypothetical protein [Ramlibacter sp.]|uniref:hypothetical protein n=1 Tax=Ramlibacter sp. TaxID=1917967 RepID=UPI0017A3DD37|nr:hypothetical protein [Ramlibacter sp.]MBA2673963.1 hypothetical protein [Ramlibacter sp.]